MKLDLGLEMPRQKPFIAKRFQRLGNRHLLEHYE